MQSLLQNVFSPLLKVVPSMSRRTNLIRPSNSSLIGSLNALGKVQLGMPGRARPSKSPGTIRNPYREHL